MPFRLSAVTVSAVSVTPKRRRRNVLLRFLARKNTEQDILEDSDEGKFTTFHLTASKLWLALGGH